jgi:hypothetical protein
MSGGFRVDIAALEKASTGVNDILLDLQNKKVSDIGAAKADYGHDGLAGVVNDFCGRWEIGVEHLAKDTSQIANRLALSAQAYVRQEHAIAGRMTQILQETSGADPAALQW